MYRLFVATVLAVALAASGCTGKKAETPKTTGTPPVEPKADAPSFAYITNGVADFWTLAAAGAIRAGEDLGVKVEIITPSSMTDQTRKIEDLLTRGTNGIAI